MNATRERILKSGLDLLSESGLSGVTLGVLAQRVGMSKSGLFAHFRSKESVQIALLEHMAEVSTAVVIQPAMRSPKGLPRLKALVKNWLGWPAKAGLRGGCPVAAAMFELDDTEGEVRDRASAMEAYWRSLLSGMVQEAVELKQLDPKLDVEQFVWELCGIYLSHHASRRFLRDPGSDTRAEKAFESLLKRAKAKSTKMGKTIPRL